jgi:hypothetical protein
MGTIRVEANVGLTPDALWNEMKDFGELSKFLHMVSESKLVEGESAKRVCVMTSGAVLNESLLNHDDAARTLTYTITDGVPLATHESTMSVEDTGDGRSTFHWTTDATAADGAPEGFLEMFEGMLADEIAQLKQRWP